ncbi:putative FMN-dependent luciferase-like monooxygenase [Pseudonocardia ailaonensis]|uniref:FMN-dependent luciferase-like monooxygenase n=1 Tax=Pseudonocardia ailaonensis TaxID=367279 RepID=A0ABN2MQV0_9PSEU
MTAAALRTAQEIGGHPPVPGLSFFLTIPVDPDPGRVYADALASLRLAEELGFETAWVAEGHFQFLGVPSALTFLAAAAQVSTTIRLGTAVLPLAFDNPVRVAETAALVDALSGGRLELGVGKSNPGAASTAIFTAFGLSEDDRETLYADALGGLKGAVSHGIPAGDRHVQLYPPTGALAGRVWQATGNPVTAAGIGRSGDGLLLFRTTPQGDPGEVQARLVDAYLEALPLGATPRIGISRGVLPAESRAAAVALIARERERTPERFVTFAGPAVQTPEDYLRALNVKYGTADDIVEQLGQDAAFVRSTDHLFSLPVPAGSPAFTEGLRQIAQEIHPRVRATSPVS